MIITQTPSRISFLGGGTDYPAYFRCCDGGATLAAAINQYITITIHPLTKFIDCCLRVHYSKLESVTSIDQIQHPSARECLRFMKIEEGVEIHYINDLPARTGLGSSSAATVGLLLALHAFKGEVVSSEQVAQEAVYVEQEMIKELVGCQDQYICALGGVLHLLFHKNGEVGFERIDCIPERLKLLQSRLMLFYTGVQRDANLVLDEQIANTQCGQNHAQLDKLKLLTIDGTRVLKGNADLREFGRLLHEGWMLKRQLSRKVATAAIDQAYDAAYQAGAIGGKLLGAGAGGFLLFYVEPEKQDPVRKALSRLPEARFAFDYTGSKVIFPYRWGG